MKAHEACTAWNPVGEDGPLAGRVVVAYGRDRQPGWSDGYRRTGGACHLEVTEARGDKSALLMFIEFHTLVVRDGISLDEAHGAFLAIDEYRAMIAPDIPGAAED